MPSTVSRAEVERLHRLMIEAAIELARLDARVEQARSEERLTPELRPWSEAAAVLDEALVQAHAALLEAGTPQETIDRIRAGLGSLQARLADFDLEFDLEECDSTWETVVAEIPRLAGPSRDALLRLLRELQPGVDEAIAALSDASREGFLERQRRKVAELERQRDAARERFERLRQAWLDALRTLEEEEARAVVVVASAQEEPEPEPPVAVLLPLPPQRKPPLPLPPPEDVEAQPPPEEPRLQLPPPEEPKLPLPPPEEPEIELSPPQEVSEEDGEELEEEAPPELVRVERELPLPPEPEFVVLREGKPEPAPETRVVKLPPEPRKPEVPLPKPPPREEPELPPPPKFVHVRERHPPESAPPKPIVVEAPPPLPPPPRPKLEAKPPPLPPPPRPRVVVTPPPPEAKPPPPPVRKVFAPDAHVAVERIDRVGPFPPGEDGIGRGGQTATIWFRGAHDEVPVLGSAAIALGCATRLDVMPALDVLAPVPGRPRRGRLSLLLISSGGQLAGVAPEKARAAARAAAASAAANLAARLGGIGGALQPAIREALEDAAAKVFARALPSAERGDLALGRALSRELRRRRAMTARLERMLALLARRKAQLAARRERAEEPARAPEPGPVAAKPPPPAEPPPAIVVEQPRPAEVEDPGIADESLDLDSAAPDTWLGSGEGVRLFSDVFGAFLPAEGRRRKERRRAEVSETPPREEAKGAFFARVFDDLEQFADHVGRWAKAGSRLAGKGMHYAETGMHRLSQLEKAAERVHAFTSGAERFLGKLGLHGLAAIAGKAGQAAESVDANAHLVHRGLRDADRSAGEAKRRIDEVGEDASIAAEAFHEAAQDGPGRGGAAAGEEAAPVLDEPRRLDLLTLSRMEEFLGDDLSGVRIHTGPGAAEVTRRFGAEAVAVRDHVFFAPGRFRPATAEGQKLIAHELTHVLQRGRQGLDAGAAEAEALGAERRYGQGPHMETLSLRRPAPDFRLAEEEEPATAAATVHGTKRTRSKGDEAAGKDAPPDGEEFLEQVSGRVYELLMEELAQGFDSR